MTDMKITVVGTGYVGLVTGVCLASVGHDVICIDINSRKIDLLKKGKSPIYENGLEEMLEKHRDRISFTTDPVEAYSDAEIIMVGVGTPERSDGSCDLTYVYSVADDIVEYSKGTPIVIIKSTVPIGTCQKFKKYVNSRMSGGRQVSVVSNPEFLSQGTAVQDTLNASRIVIGSDDADAIKTVRKVYEPLGIPIIETDFQSSEMIKYASNNYLALRISYINEIANLCEEVGADIGDVAKGMGYDKRIGSMFLKAGIGYGGSCFPKDTKALYWLSEDQGAALKTIKATIDVNAEQKFVILKKAEKYYDDFNGLAVAVLGLSFKPGTDDVREAPSLKIIPSLLERGATVRAWDPIAGNNFSKLHPEHITYCASMEAALDKADLCLILTEWEDVLNFNVEKYAQLMKKPIVIDGRNCYPISSVKGKGIIYESIGRQPVKS